MAAQVRVKIHAAAAKSILKGEGVQRDLRERAGRIAAAANARAGTPGSGYIPSVRVGPARARGSVITATPEAMRNESRNRTLLHSLDAGRR